MEEHVDGKAPGDEGPKRKVIGVESEETQDYGRESLNLSGEEAGEISFVPSAISIPRGPMFWCGNRCREKSEIDKVSEGCREIKQENYMWWV